MDKKGKKTYYSDRQKGVEADRCEMEGVVTLYPEWEAKCVTMLHLTNGERKSEDS